MSSCISHHSIEARRRAEQIDGGDLDVDEACLLEHRAQPVLIGERERARCRVARRGVGETMLLDHATADCKPWIRRGRSQTASETRPPALSTRRVSNRAADGSTMSMYPQRHSTASRLATGRSIDSALMTRNFDVSELELASTRPRELDHRLRLVARDQDAARQDQLSRQQPGFAWPGGELQHTLPRLQVERLDQRLRDRRRKIA